MQSRSICWSKNRSSVMSILRSSRNKGVIGATKSNNNNLKRTSSRSWYKFYSSDGKPIDAESPLFHRSSSSEEDVSYFANEALRRMVNVDERRMLETPWNDSSSSAAALPHSETENGANSHSKSNTGSAHYSTAWMQLVQELDRSKPLTRAHLYDLLKAFQPDCPPPPTDTYSYQLWLECESKLESTFKYERTLELARKNKQFSQLTIVQKHVLHWYDPLREAIENVQKSLYLPSNSDVTDTDTTTDDDDASDKSTDIDTSAKSSFKQGDKYGVYVSLLQPEKLAVIAAHEAITFILVKGGSAPLAALSVRIGEAVEAEVNLQKLFFKRRDPADKLLLTDDYDADSATTTPAQPHLHAMYAESNLLKFIEEASRTDPTANKNQRMHVKAINKRAKKLLNSNDEWSTIAKAKLGAMLVELLIRTATALHTSEPYFYHEKKWLRNRRLVGYLSISADSYKQFMETNRDALLNSTPYNTKFQPMVRPPREWTNISNDGGPYYILSSSLMRTKGCKPQAQALRVANLDKVFDGLNALGRVSWKINVDILEAAKRCWDDAIVLGDIPSQFDFDVPPLPEKPAFINRELFENKNSEEYEKLTQDWKTFRSNLYRYKKMKQKNMDLYSLRCSAMLKLNQAEKLKDCEEIYFPYNLDFRGRAYPIPPHLSNIGSDLCRGMLKFKKSKPLGERGLFWLKVHLANLAGADKMPFEARAAFTENNMDNIRAAAEDSFGDFSEGKGKWWMSVEDPFQALATCKEIIRAVDSGDPASYECSLPVHMDGSCNGLQHYAALGRDSIGGRAVNLCDCDVPQDVYVFVMKRVIDLIAKEAATTPDVADPLSESLSIIEKKALRNNAAAKLVNGLIDRGVVKRTVMTSVYGVTYIGARKQIQEKIEEKLEAAGVDIDERADEVHAASGYLASVTMDVMGELFQGARTTMNWLAECAKLIAARGQPMAWLSPVGVPVVQPYRASKTHTVVTLLQSMLLTGNSDSLPIHKGRQVTAFPPNYVHSLDSSHMLLTALEMDRRGLAFTAVHDSFWTHPADVDEMNLVLRECFIDLYKRPLLEELKKNWELRYPDIEFPDVPERGDLDLEEVMKARYFFQ